MRLQMRTLGLKAELTGFKVFMFIHLFYLGSERIWGALWQQRHESSCLTSPWLLLWNTTFTQKHFHEKLKLNIYNKTWILSSTLRTKKFLRNFFLDDKIGMSSFLPLPTWLWNYIVPREKKSMHNQCIGHAYSKSEGNYT